METKPGEHPLFLSAEGAKRHAVWLRDMKEQFLARRQQLKAVTSKYTRIGNWVAPHSKA